MASYEYDLYGDGNGAGEGVQEPAFFDLLTVDSSGFDNMFGKITSEEESIMELMEQINERYKQIKQDQQDQKDEQNKKENTWYEPASKRVNGDTDVSSKVDDINMEIKSENVHPLRRIKRRRANF